MNFDVERKVKWELLGCTHCSYILFLINKKECARSSTPFPNNSQNNCGYPLYSDRG